MYCSTILKYENNANFLLSVCNLIKLHFFFNLSMFVQLHNNNSRKKREEEKLEISKVYNLCK